MNIQELLNGDELARISRYKDPTRTRINVGERLAILVVDVTNAYVDDRFSANCGSSGKQAAHESSRLLAVARAAGLPVIYSRGQVWATEAERGYWKSQTVADSGEQTKLPDPYGIASEVAPQDGDVVVVKSKPSAFFGTHLTSVLNHLRIDTLIVVGMATSGCVRATVVDAFSLSYRVIVPREAVADRIRISHECALFDMDLKYADVVNIEDLIEQLLAVNA